MSQAINALLLCDHQSWEAQGDESDGPVCLECVDTLKVPFTHGN